MEVSSIPPLLYLMWVEPHYPLLSRQAKSLISWSHQTPPTRFLLQLLQELQSTAVTCQLHLEVHGSPSGSGFNTTTAVLPLESCSGKQPSYPMKKALNFLVVNQGDTSIPTPGCHLLGQLQSGKRVKPFSRKLVPEPELCVEPSRLYLDGISTPCVPA